jgi:HK97 family phage prohead protease
MAVTTRGGMTVPDLSAPEIDPAIAAHEARHAAAALLLGLKVTEARADNPNSQMGGYVALGGYSCLRPRDSGIMTLAGRWGDPGWPPESPSKQGRTFDERNLADDVETLNRGHAGYLDMVADTERLVRRPEFKSLVDVLEELLARGCVLREGHIRVIHEACGKPELEHKTVTATSRVSTDLGEFTALAAAWSRDRQGDQIVRGAFAHTIKAWQDRNRPIPLHWAHKGDAEYIIGRADPDSLREIAEGLYVKGKLDLDGSDMAREAWRLVKARNVALSFGYLVTDAVKRADGIQELRELDLYEISLTPAPANPDTRILSFKSTDPPESETEHERDTLSPEYRRLRDQARDEMYALLTAPLESDPEVVLEREEKRQARELRRKCDRLLLEAALGFDQDLIDKLDL